MGRLVALFVLLCAFWLLLSGTYYPWLLSIGLASVLLTVWLAWRMSISDEEGLPLALTPRTFTYWPWLVVEIFKSAIGVTRIVLDPKLPISPTMIRVQGDQKTAAGFTTYANSITLTPGTISVEAVGRKREILVHCLTAEHARELEDGTMNRHVAAFEGKA